MTTQRSLLDLRTEGICVTGEGVMHIHVSSAEIWLKAANESAKCDNR
jgi:hypothetical protein